MGKNEEFLQYIYQNAQMGKSTIDQILKIVDDVEFKDVLEEQIADYEHVLEEVEILLKELFTTPKEISNVTKFMTYFNIKMSTVKDNTSSYLAEMLVKGSNMGIMQITEKLHGYKRLKPQVRKLGEKLLKIEEVNEEKLKEYL